MSQKVNKHPLNTSGRYYVDYDCCVNHEICVYNAPDNIRIDRENYGAYFFKQPDSPEEEEQCREALKECPMEAIRDDGETEIVTGDVIVQLPVLASRP